MEGTNLKNLEIGFDALSNQAKGDLFRQLSEKEIDNTKLEAVKQGVTKNSLNFKKNIRRGFQEIITAVESTPSWLTSMECQTLKEELIRANHMDLSLKNASGSYVAALSKGKSLGVALEFTDESLHSMYAIAYHFLQEQEFEKTSAVFTLLCALEPTVHMYWYGLGLSEQGCKRWKLALQAYSMAMIMKYETPYPHLRSSECYEALNDLFQAKAALELAIEIATEGGKEFESVKRVAMGKIKLL